MQSQRSGQAFATRFKPREIDGVTVLNVDGRLESTDCELLLDGVKEIIEGGKRGFVCDLSQFDIADSGSRGAPSLGHLLFCCAGIGRLGGVVNWLHAGSWMDLLKVTTPNNFCTEAEAALDVRQTLDWIDSHAQKQ